ncbi:DUF669 domain-containing protein [Candidatus Fukatsuia endosymbiont of Tuberolachnus salignus]|uniref:DUF669 domain-containing protein n=1 Tax=Candidatus Fukatsuia endosymbiont of Tuberolachnus salignus TaxID=3077957 RepID=UPI00313DD423
MNEVIFTYHQEAALAAGQSGFISESGAYIVTLTEAKYMTSPSGAKSIEFSVETEDGRKAHYLNLYYEKKDSTPNPYGVNLINAMMGCTGIKQLTRVVKDINAPLAPELIGKKIGLVLQKTLKTKSDGKDTYSLDIQLPFFAQTRQTLQEKMAGKPATTLNKIVANLKDKDERQPRANLSPSSPGKPLYMPSSLPQSNLTPSTDFNDDGDDIPF